MLDAASLPVTHAIIGAALEVHRHLGPGYLESAYGDALEVELPRRGLMAQRECPLRVVYKGRELRTRYRADFVVGDILVELKSQATLTGIDEAQVIHYLRTTGLRVALLINFGSKSCEVRRFASGPFLDGDKVSVESVIRGSSSQALSFCDQFLRNFASFGRMTAWQ